MFNINYLIKVVLQIISYQILPFVYLIIWYYLWSKGIITLNF